MTTIFTGTLVATGQQGVLSTGKSVWLNSQFVHEMTTTEYVDTAGATQTGTLVLYKAGDGTELLNLIFSDSLATLQGSMNTQPTNKNTLNVWEMEYAPSSQSLNYAFLYVDTTKIWWIENGKIKEYLGTFDEFNEWNSNRIVENIPIVQQSE